MSETEDPASQVESAEFRQADDYEDDRTALNDLPDGVGCTEIWEHLSERRRQD